MLDHEYISLLQEIIRTPSFSREEKEVCDILQEWMQEHGISTERNGNNIWSVYDPEKQDVPTILLNAHTDTVRPSSSYTRDPFSPDREGDKIYGLGSNDDGGSLIALLATYRQISATKGTKKEYPYRVIFSATAEEEVCGKGGIDLIKDEWGDIALGIIGEPTGMRMAVAERGLMVLDCTAHGVSGHAARNEGVNAIYKAIEDINKLRAYHFERVSEYLGEVKTSVTMIQAGTQHNVVPDTCSFVADIRSNGLYSNEDILERIRQQVSSEVKARSTRMNASHIDMGHPIVKAAQAAGRELFGSPTTSNQTLLSFPTVKIGPGDSARSHTADEYILISEIEEAITIYLQLLNTVKL